VEEHGAGIGDDMRFFWGSRIGWERVLALCGIAIMHDACA
jgi:hypothetical protein